MIIVQPIVAMHLAFHETLKLKPQQNYLSSTSQSLTPKQFPFAKSGLTRSFIPLLPAWSLPQGNTMTPTIDTKTPPWSCCTRVLEFQGTTEDIKNLHYLTYLTPCTLPFSANKIKGLQGSAHLSWTLYLNT